MSYDWGFTRDEEVVLLMAAGRAPWQRGAWVNACAELLQEAGFLSRDHEQLTERGRRAVEKIHEKELQQENSSRKV
jgi:hypothetical protein